MRPVSDRFLEAIRGSHRAQVQAFVVAPGQTGVSPTGTEIEVLDGDVQLDAKAAIRSTLTMTTEGAGLFPEQASDDFAPYGNEIFVRRGIAFGGGAIEWVSLGYHRINSTEQDDAPDGPIRLACQDRMSGIVEARLLTPQQFPATSTYGEVLAALVEEVFPWAIIEWDDSIDGDIIGRALIVEEDRYAFLDELVTSLGKIWYWDYAGKLQIKDPPSADATVWTVNSGQNGVLVSLSRELAREGVYNAVVAYGEALDTEPPPRSAVVDDNPESPTYWYGNFGKVPRYYSSPFITTNAQAESAARSILLQNLGLPYNVDFGQVPNPALEPFDPVVVKVRGRTEIHIIQTLTVPLLVTQLQTATTQEQTLVVIGEV